jgi:hypothetical protein
MLSFLSLSKVHSKIKKRSLFTLTTSGIFAFFLARQPQGVLLDRVPPFKPCANAFFFSLVVFQGRVKVAPSLSITKRQGKFSFAEGLTGGKRCRRTS